MNSRKRNNKSIASNERFGIKRGVCFVDSSEGTWQFTTHRNLSNPLSERQTARLLSETTVQMKNEMECNN